MAEMTVHDPELAVHDAPKRAFTIGRNTHLTTRPRGNGSYRPRSNGSSEPMTEGQRRYLFRIMAGQGFHKDAAENRIKEIFEVSALSEITKTAAMQMIDQLLQTSAPGNGGGNGSASRHQH